MAMCRAVVAFSATLFVGTALAQTAPHESIEPVRITGRLVYPDGRPVSFGVRLSRIDADGPKVEATATTSADGLFTFVAAPATKYEVSLGDGVRTPPKTVDTSSGKNPEIGDMVFEYCPAVSMSVPKPPPTAEFIGELKPEQIVIEPQEAVNPYRPVSDLPPATYKPDYAVGPPPCWIAPSLDMRPEWESLPMIYFDHYLTLESFVGGKVKIVRVFHYDPQLTPSQIREEVQKVWLGRFRFAASRIMWSEVYRWNIQASVEYEDGKRTAVLMDGGIHVGVEDREGKHWFIRLWPAVE